MSKVVGLDSASCAATVTGVARMTGVEVSGSDDVTQLVTAEPATGHSTIE